MKDSRRPRYSISTKVRPPPLELHVASRNARNRQNPGLGLGPIRELFRPFGKGPGTLVEPEPAASNRRVEKSIEFWNRRIDVRKRHIGPIRALRLEGAKVEFEVGYDDVERGHLSGLGWLGDLELRMIGVRTGSGNCVLTRIELTIFFLSVNNLGDILFFRSSCMARG